VCGCNEGAYNRARIRYHLAAEEQSTKKTIVLAETAAISQKYRSSAYHRPLKATAYLRRHQWLAATVPHRLACCGFAAAVAKAGGRK